MHILFGLFAGGSVLWGISCCAILWLGWRRRSLIAMVRRLAKWHAGFLVALTLLFLDIRPSVTTPLMSTAEKAELKQKLDSDSDAKLHCISLTGEELASGLRSVADLLRIEFHSEIVFSAKDQFQWRFALGHPFGYLNGSMDGSARVEEGKLETNWERLWIGRLPFVGFTRTLGQRFFCYVLNHDQISQQILASISSGEIRDHRAHFQVIENKNVIGSIATQLKSHEMIEDADLAVSIVEAWIQCLSEPPTRDAAETDLFVTGTRFLFGEAQRRAPTRSAVRQNRAAILAAAIWMGHAKFLLVTGRDMDPATYDHMEWTGGRVQVQGRNDLVRHFWVSAAITAFASSRISHLVGIGKEELDAEDGGSGFSFADLLADRAGIMFAELALGSPANAAAMQERIALDWVAGDAITSIDGLPEGIRQTEFLENYGGIEGQPYRHWSDMVDQRVRSSKLVREIR